MYSTFYIAAILDVRSPGSRSDLYTDMHSKMILHTAYLEFNFKMAAVGHFAVADPRGGGGPQQARALKLDQLCFLIHLLSECLTIRLR